ncbi:MAG TPA: hypothetical protein VMU51_38035 [Mycobacteriales bacterium]|nr:hypothetical protein [Mycobacteriales bacterium]
MSVLRRRRARELRQLRAAGWTVQTYTPADRLRARRERTARAEPTVPPWVSRGSR